VRHEFRLNIRKRLGKRISKVKSFTSLSRSKKKVGNAFCVANTTIAEILSNGWDAIVCWREHVLSEQRRLQVCFRAANKLSVDRHDAARTQICRCVFLSFPKEFCIVELDYFRVLRPVLVRMTIENRRKIHKKIEMDAGFDSTSSDVFCFFGEDNWYFFSALFWSILPEYLIH